MDFEKLLAYTLRWLTIRLRSSWEIEQYLHKKTDDETLRGDVRSWLDDHGYVSDEAFAEAWVHSRRTYKNRSRRRMRQELLQKRVSESIIAKVLDSESVGDQDAVRALILKKRISSRYQDEVKLKQYLARQGFDYETIVAAIDELAELGRDD